MVGQKVSDNIKQYFKFCDVRKEYKCLIEGCSKYLKTSYNFNWKRHIITRHKTIAVSLNLITDEDDCEHPAPTQAKKIKKMSIEMDETIFAKACVKLATINAMPFNFFDYEAFRDIVNPIQDALGIKINSHNIPSLIENTSDEIRQLIINEISGKLINLKIDAATRCGRSILGVNIQFMNGSKLKIRSLGMIELTKKHTSENLKEELLVILNQFSIPMQNIYACTTDNGANMLKAIQLLKQYCSTDTDTLPVDLSQNEESANDEDSVYERGEILVNNILSSVRCAAHTIQLTAYDVLKSHKSEISEVRNIVKNLRVHPYRNSFKVHDKKKPFFDVPTRWNSSYEMVECIHNQKDFILTIISNDEQLKISDQLWDFMDKFLSAFHPIYIATTKLQSEQLIMGDFYKIWLECKLHLEIIENEFSNELINSMERRKHKLFDNNAFLAAIYMDPRFNYIGGDLLSSSEKNKAKVSYILKYTKIVDEQYYF